MVGIVRLSSPTALDIEGVLRLVLYVQQQVDPLFWTLHRERDNVLTDAHKVYGKNNTSFTEMRLRDHLTLISLR